MKFLKILAGIIIVLVVIFLVGGLLLPKTYSVNRSTLINAPDSVIYKNIADFNEFAEWNPWRRMEPNAKITITGQTEQAGHLYEWDGKETGAGQMKIISAKPNEMVDIELKFIKPFESLADTRFDIVKEGAANKVTWTMSGESTGMLDRWMCLMMDNMIGKDFEDGLKFLKEKAEKGT